MPGRAPSNSSKRTRSSSRARCADLVTFTQVLPVQFLVGGQDPAHVEDRSRVPDELWIGLLAARPAAVLRAGSMGRPYPHCQLGSRAENEDRQPLLLALVSSDPDMQVPGLGELGIG
jgi:hypothetical protein